MKKPLLKHSLLNDFTSIALETLYQIKEENEENDIKAQPKEILIEEILRVLIDKFSPKLANSRGIIFDTSYKETTLENVNTKNKEKISFKLNLEDLFSNANERLEIDGVVILFSNKIDQNLIGNHSSLKILLRLFYTTCNYLFNGLTNSKVAIKSSEEDLSNTFLNRNIDSSFEIRDSYLWKIFCPSSSGFNMFANNNIDLSGRASGTSTPYLDVYDMANIKILMINAFDTINDIKDHLNIPFLATGPFSELYHIITKFIDKNGFIALMLNRHFQPISTLMTRPNFLKALRNDTRTGNLKMKEEVVLFLQHLKFELLKFCQNYVLQSNAPLITQEERANGKHVSLLIERLIRRLDESLEMKNDKEKLIFEISSVLMPEGTDTKKMFSITDFDSLMDSAEFKEQVNLFITSYGELKPEFEKEVEKEDEKKKIEDTEKEPIENSTEEKKEFTEKQNDKKPFSAFIKKKK